jgi:hypothetical protein
MKTGMKMNQPRIPKYKGTPLKTPAKMEIAIAPNIREPISCGP